MVATTKTVAAAAKGGAMAIKVVAAVGVNVVPAVIEIFFVATKIVSATA